jgi:hypothetical protein
MTDIILHTEQRCYSSWVLWSDKVYGPEEKHHDT